MPIIAKLKDEIARYQNKPFLKAAMAVCALTCLADGRDTLTERYQVDSILATLDRLRIYDPHEAIDILGDYLYHLEEDRQRAVAVLEEKVRRYAGDYKAARTLLRIAYLVITADGEASAAERAMFDEISAALAVEPKEIWDKLAGRRA